MPTALETDAVPLSSKDGSTHVEAQGFAYLASRPNFWSDSAPKKVLGDNNWESWMRHLVKRGKPAAVDALCAAKGSSLLWGLDACRLSSMSSELLQLIECARGKGKFDQATTEGILSRWQQRKESQPQSVGFAMECLALANLLPIVGQFIDSHHWWSLLDVLGEIVTCTDDWQIDAEMPAESCVVYQLLAGELPLTLAYLFPEIRPLVKLRKSAHDALSECLIELCNGEGLPRASHLEQFRALVASWTRCRAMGGEIKKSSWSKKADNQYCQAVGQALILSSATGAPLLAREHTAGWSPDFLEAALKLGGTSADRTAAIDMLDKKLTKHLSGKSGKVVPETSCHCEWAGLAIMRTEFSRSAPVVAVDYATPDLKLDVWVGTQRLIAGMWSAETFSEGKKLEPRGVWEETCWFSDEDVDYLELAIDLSEGARLERQILLARDDLFLLLVDHVLDAPGDTIRHQFSLPLDSDVHFLAETETREGTLGTTKQISRVLPLALPEWRSDPRRGELIQVADRLQLTQERPGRRLACPLLFDLDPARLGKPCTWRQLTVAQSLEIQPHDVAVGYRVQCDKSQWLIYRSLAPPANRSVLGQNTSVECLVGRFLAPGGEVEELLQVEG